MGKTSKKRKLENSSESNDSDKEGVVGSSKNPPKRARQSKEANAPQDRDEENELIPNKSKKGNKSDKKSFQAQVEEENDDDEELIPKKSKKGQKNDEDVKPVKKQKKEQSNTEKGSRDAEADEAQQRKKKRDNVAATIPTSRPSIDGDSDGMFVRQEEPIMRPSPPAWNAQALEDLANRRDQAQSIPVRRPEEQGASASSAQWNPRIVHSSDTYRDRTQRVTVKQEEPELAHLPPPRTTQNPLSLRPKEPTPHQLMPEYGQVEQNEASQQTIKPFHPQTPTIYYSYAASFGICGLPGRVMLWEHHDTVFRGLGRVESIHFPHGATDEMLEQLVNYDNGSLRNTVVDVYCSFSNASLYSPKKTITDSGVTVFVKSFPNLRQLILERAPNVTDISMYTILTLCKNLEYLCISGPIVNSETNSQRCDAVKLLAQSSDICPRLKKLVLHNYPCLEDDTVKAVTAKRTGLEIETGMGVHKDTRHLAKIFWAGESVAGPGTGRRLTNNNGFSGKPTPRSEAYKRRVKKE